jgi:hypothetical protein
MLALVNDGAETHRCGLLAQPLRRSGAQPASVRQALYRPPPAHSKAKIAYYGHDLHFQRLGMQAQRTGDAQLAAEAAASPSAGIEFSAPGPDTD